MPITTSYTEDKFNELDESIKTSGMYMQSSDGDYKLDLNSDQIDEISNNTGLKSALGKERLSVKGLTSENKNLTSKLQELISNLENNPNDDSVQDQSNISSNADAELLRQNKKQLDDLTGNNKELELKYAKLMNEYEESKISSNVNKSISDNSLDGKYIDIINSVTSGLFGKNDNGDYFVKDSEGDLTNQTMNNYFQTTFKEKYPKLYLNDITGSNTRTNNKVSYGNNGTIIIKAGDSESITKYYREIASGKAIIQ